MKRLAANVLFWMLVSFASALLMTSAACPDGEVFCLVKE